MFFYLFLFLFFIIWPLGAFLISMIFFFKKKLYENQMSFCLLIMSLFWGLLAFSQKSLTPEDTDCIRYYFSFEYFENYTPIEAFSNLNFLELLNFTFYPVSVFIVSLTKNVQSISFLWTSLVYLLTFLSMKRLMNYYNCFNQKDFAKIVLVMSFCFMAFVQISELLKNSAAFAVFFYGFTIYITNGKRLYVLILIFFSIGLHTSVIMLFPLFFYKVINTKVLIGLGVILFILSKYTNIINILMKFLPEIGYFDLLQNRFGTYDITQSATLHYVVIQLVMFFSAFYLWFKNKESDKILTECTNIVLLYFIISSLNSYNLVAYLRFTIFSHWLFGLILIMYIKKTKLYILGYKKIMNIMILIMFLMTLRWTYGRTLVRGGYCSSYMDNSITKIITSTSYNYLIVDYEK